MLSRCICLLETCSKQRSQYIIQFTSKSSQLNHASVTGIPDLINRCNVISPPANYGQYPTNQRQHIGYNGNSKAGVIVYVVDSNEKREFAGWKVVLGGPHVQASPTIILDFCNKHRPFSNDNKNYNKNNINLNHSG